MSKLRFLFMLALAQPLLAETATVRGNAGGEIEDATVNVVIDSDRDGLSDSLEAANHTDPANPDSDGDGLNDYKEVTDQTDPLVNQFAADPDWASVPVGVRNNVRAFWDFETKNTNGDFKSRKGNNINASAILTQPAVWNESEGMFGKSAKVGGPVGNALTVSPVKIWPTHRTWTMAFTVKFSSVPSSAANWPFFGAYCGASNQSNQAAALQLSLHFGPLTNQSGDKLFFRLSGVDGLYGEWIVPQGSNLSQWTDLVFSCNGQLANNGFNRKCYVNGAEAEFNNSTGYGPINGPGLNQDGYVLLGGTRGTNGTLLKCPTSFLVDRWLIADFDGEDLPFYANPDTDQDGIPDRKEIAEGSNPFVYEPDIDGDGLTNSEERTGKAIFNGTQKNFGFTSSTNVDSDGDFFDDLWEAKYFASNVAPNNAVKPIKDNPATPLMIEGDYDSDGLSNFFEFLNDTDPNDSDTDNDGISDKVESQYGSDPTDGSDKPLDPGDYHSDEDLGNFDPIGYVGEDPKPGEDDSPTVEVVVGDPSDSKSERWRLSIGNEKVEAEAYGELIEETIVLDPTDFHEVRLQHVDTDPSKTPDYDYWASVRPTSGSPFILCDLEGLLNDPSDDPEDDFFDGVDLAAVSGKTAYLVPLDNTSWATSYSGGDAVGPQYRKVALNGRPIPDEKPQQEEETDLPDEETYIDAFNLSLHHDTTFHYAPLAASDLVLQASISSEETNFSDRSGLRPHERFDLPFGVGWSSNLCSYVEVVETIGDDSSDPVTVNVVDEAGRPQRFGTRDFKSFFPWPSTRVDKKTYLNKLNRNGSTFTLQKKFGNTLTFQSCKTWFLYSTDRTDGSSKLKRHTYWRLTEARDRYGVRLHYDYNNKLGEPNDVALIPRKISSPDRPGQFLEIVRSPDSRRVTRIIDSKLNETVFNYNQTEDEYYLLGDETDPHKLTGVTFPDKTTIGYTYESVVDDEIDTTDGNNPRLTFHYHTNLKSVTDKRGNTHTFDYVIDHSKEYWDSNVNGNRCAIDLDRLPADVRDYVLQQIAERNEEGHGVWKTMHGLPRKVWQVTLPGGAGTTRFTGAGQMQFREEVTFLETPKTEVTDATGKKTIYRFEGPSAELVDVDLTKESVSKEWMVYYLTSRIHHGGEPGDLGYVGTEVYQFDETAGLSLCSATDMSGNVTTWEFENVRDVLAAGLPEGSTTMTRWSDPTAKVDALNRRETYEYSGSYRIMEEINDPFGTLTTFNVDSLGRRTLKSVDRGPNDILEKERYDYGNQRFKGFQTGMSKLAFENVSGQNWEVSLETSYLPDANGRVWREIVDPRKEKLVTEHTYDVNNNRTSTRDPKGNLTSFKYDKLNRLVQVTHPIAGTRNGEAITTRQIWYNENGDKAAEIDEEGNYTIHHYDALNRLVVTIRDMDKQGLPIRNEDGIVTEATKGSITAGDLTTYFGYNAVGSVTFQMDALGNVTRTFYDSIQRPIHIFTGLPTGYAISGLQACVDAADASPAVTHTEYRYTDATLILPEGGAVKGNPGGSAFNTSGFKPTEIIKYGAVKTATGTLNQRTYAQYDALYRPLRTETEYEAGTFSVTTTRYGDVDPEDHKETLGSTSTDDRGKKTRTEVDGLQRVTSVTDGFETPLAATTQTLYSSTGLVWKTIDAEGREAETEYDGVGRAVSVWQPDPITGLVNRSTPSNPLLGSPRTQTAYDRNGNVTVNVNPLGYRWEYEFDARNRRTLERQPSVTELEMVGGQPVESALQNPEIITSYDGVGTVIAVKNARGHVTRSFHDQAYRVTDVLTNPVTGIPSTNPQSPGQNDILVHTDYDRNGNVLALIDGNGNATRNSYDSLNRLATTSTNPVTGQPSADPLAPNAGDITVANAYDDSDHLVKVTDGEGHVTGFRYDGLGRKTRTIWDEGSAVAKVEQATFDGVVQLTRTNPQDSQLTTYQYDALNRLENTLYTGRPADNRHYAYDLVGNVLDVTYPNETVARQILRGASQRFDKLNRLVEETSAGATHIHTYDKAGNRRTTGYAASERFLVSTYDKLNRLLTCTEKASSTATTGNLTTYAYDLNGNVTRKVLPNRSATLSTFDALNRKLGEETKTVSGGMISGFDYSQPANGNPSGYDAVGNVLKIVEKYGHANVKDRTVVNVYDRSYRLDTETIVETGGTTVVANYDYDDANNRTQKAVTGGSNPGTWISAYGTTADGYNSNQLKSVIKGATATTFLYDGNGNRSTKRVGGTTVQTYGYDFENRLVALTDNVKGSFAYAYDHRTRRVGRNESSAGGLNEELSFAGGLSVQEYTSGSGTPTVEYIRGSDYGGGIGGVLYTIRDGSTRSYNAYNSRGDVISKTNDGGIIDWQASYEAFGQRTQEGGDTLDRQKANTKDEDPTGLLNEGMRYRDLEFGVFLTRDPAGFVDGPNVYTYVRQNPWTSFDPEGLAEFKIGGFVFLFFERGIMGAVSRETSWDAHVPTLGEFMGNNFKANVDQVKSDPQQAAKDLGSGYLDPENPPDSLAGRAGQILGVAEALSGSKGTSSGTAKPSLATANGVKVQGDVLIQSPPSLPAGAVFQTTEGSSPTGNSAKGTSQGNAQNEGPYSHLKDHKSVGPGKKFTSSQKKRILTENEKANGGTLKDDVTGEELVRPQQHRTGVRPPDNEAHIDHVDPRSEQGPNSFDNAHVRSRRNNLEKSNKK